MVVAKRKQGKVRENRKEEGPRTRVRTSGKTNSPPGNPVYIGQAQGEEKNIKRGAKIELGSLFSLRLLSQLALMPRGCIFLCLPNKTEL